MKEQQKQEIQTLVKTKKNHAFQILNPTIEKIWKKVLLQMDASQDLYPTVKVSWFNTKPQTLTVSCEDQQEEISINPLPLAPSKIKCFLHDLTSSETFNNFHFDFNVPTQTYPEYIEFGFEAKIRLKTLF